MHPISRLKPAGKAATVRALGLVLAWVGKRGPFRGPDGLPPLKRMSVLRVIDPRQGLLTGLYHLNMRGTPRSRSMSEKAMGSVLLCSASVT